jgi:hypothetical protein
MSGVEVSHNSNQTIDLDFSCIPACCAQYTGGTVLTYPFGQLDPSILTISAGNVPHHLTIG